MESVDGLISRLQNLREQMVGAPRVVESLSLGALSSGAAFVHVYRTGIFHAPAAPPRTRLLRALDAGVVVFCLSSSIAWYLAPSRSAEVASRADDTCEFVSDPQQSASL